MKRKNPNRWLCFIVQHVLLPFSCHHCANQSRDQQPAFLSNICGQTLIKIYETSDPPLTLQLFKTRLFPVKPTITDCLFAITIVRQSFARGLILTCDLREARGSHSCNLLVDCYCLTGSGSICPKFFNISYWLLESIRQIQALLSLLKYIIYLKKILKKKNINTNNPPRI